MEKELLQKAIEEEKCEECGGTGEVSVMERVYPNEPHMAPIGSEVCEVCGGTGYVDSDEE